MAFPILVFLLGHVKAFPVLVFLLGHAKAFPVLFPCWDTPWRVRTLRYD